MVKLFPTSTEYPDDYIDRSDVFEYAPVEYSIENFEKVDGFYVNTQPILFGDCIAEEKISVQGIGVSEMVEHSSQLIVIMRLINTSNISPGSDIEIRPGDLEIDEQLFEALKDD